jgi:hypothetical protein
VAGPRGAAQAPDDGLLAPALHPRGYRRREPLALDTGHREQPPVRLGCLNSSTVLIPLGAHFPFEASEQLDGEQLNALGVVVQPLGERDSQTVRLAVDIRRDKRTPIGPVQADQAVAVHKAIVWLFSRGQAAARPAPRQSRTLAGRTRVPSIRLFSSTAAP